MSVSIIPTAYVISNIVAVILLGCSWKYPNVARLLFSALFCWASIVNARAAITHPIIYMEYSQFALSFYKNFILGYFSQHITAIVLAIAIVQFAIAISLWLRGMIFKIGCICAIVFLVCITPLGTGAAFPCTLILAASLLLLLYKKNINFLWINFFLAQEKSEEASEIL